MTRYIIMTITCLTLCFGAATAIALDQNQPTKTKHKKKAREQAVKKSLILVARGQHQKAIQHSQSQLKTDLKMPLKQKAQHYRSMGVAYKHLDNIERACHFLGKAVKTKQLPKRNARGIKRYMKMLKCPS